jgi:hypothetical protein
MVVRQEKQYRNIFDEKATNLKMLRFQNFDVKDRTFET